MSMVQDLIDDSVDFLFEQIIDWTGRAQNAAGYRSLIEKYNEGTISAAAVESQLEDAQFLGGHGQLRKLHLNIVELIEEKHSLEAVDKDVYEHQFANALPEPIIPFGLEADGMLLQYTAPINQASIEDAKDAAHPEDDLDENFAENAGASTQSARTPPTYPIRFQMDQSQTSNSHLVSAPSSVRLIMNTDATAAYEIDMDFVTSDGNSAYHPVNRPRFVEASEKEIGRHLRSLERQWTKEGGGRIRNLHLPDGYKLFQYFPPNMNDTRVTRGTRLYGHPSGKYFCWNVGYQNVGTGCVAGKMRGIAYLGICSSESIYIPLPSVPSTNIHTYTASLNQTNTVVLLHEALLTLT